MVAGQVMGEVGGFPLPVHHFSPAEMPHADRTLCHLHQPSAFFVTSGIQTAATAFKVSNTAFFQTLLAQVIPGPALDPKHLSFDFSKREFYHAPRNNVTSPM